MRELTVLETYPDSMDGCRCDGGQPKNFARPCLLLLLAEEPAHGYALLERLRPFGFEISDPAMVYKLLRQLEREGLAASEWDTSTSRGPARRVYALTPDGIDLLDAWAQTLRQSRAVLDLFLTRAATQTAAPKNTSKPASVSMTKTSKTGRNQPTKPRPSNR